MEYLRLTIHYEENMTTPNLLDMCEIVEKRVQELMREFRSRYQNTMFNVDDPHSIYFDLKGTTAGQSCFRYSEGRGYLRFNRQIMKDNWERFDQTIIHEVAHYCVSILHGRILNRRGTKRVIHGTEWKNMMRFLGGETNRCHSYDTSNCSAKRKMATYSYMCDCQFFELTQVRHNKILRGRKYSCQSCNGELIRV